MCKYGQLLQRLNKTAHYFLQSLSDLTSLVHIRSDHLRNDRAEFPEPTDAFYISKAELLLFFPFEHSGKLETDMIFLIKFGLTYGKALIQTVSKLCC